MSRLERRLLADVARASHEHGLIEPGDRILVGLSGGKDSYALMSLLEQSRRKAPFEFTLVGVNLDQGHPGFPQEVIANWCVENGFEHRMLKKNTYAVVLDKVPEGKTYCSLCSRLRRGILYDAAVDLGCTKIALGHHRDDVIETFLLNVLYSGQIKAMPAKLRSDDGRNTIIRPLAYCSESDLAEYAAEQRFPVIPCDLCGSQENLYRKRIKRLLTDLEADNPKIKGNLFASLANVQPSHLYDRDLAALVGLAGGADEALGAIDGGAPGDCASEA